MRNSSSATWLACHAPYIYHNLIVLQII